MYRQLGNVKSVTLVTLHRFWTDSTLPIWCLMVAIADITNNCQSKNSLKCSDSLLQQSAAVNCGVSGRW